MDQQTDQENREQDPVLYNLYTPNSSQGLAPALHPKLDLHAIQLRGGAALGYQGFTALVFWLAAAPDQGAVGETQLFRRQAKKARVQATKFYWLVLLIGGG